MTSMGTEWLPVRVWGLAMATGDPARPLREHFRPALERLAAQSSRPAQHFVRRADPRRRQQEELQPRMSPLKQQHHHHH